VNAADRRLPTRLLEALRTLHRIDPRVTEYLEDVIVNFIDTYRIGGNRSTTVSLWLPEVPARAMKQMLRTWRAKDRN
jgi:hypothetical protein